MNKSYCMIAFQSRINRHFRFEILYFAFFLIVFSVNGQSPEVVKYGLKDGLLTEASNFHSFQDSKGFIWICSSIGVNRFDGVDFKHYDGALVNHLKPMRGFEDPNGTIWVMTYEGELLRLENDTFKVYPISKKAKSLIRLFQTLQFEVDQLGNIYLGTSKEGLWKIDTTGNAIPLITSKNGIKGIGIWISESFSPIAFGIGVEEDWRLEDSVSLYDQEFKLSSSSYVNLDQQTPDVIIICDQGKDGLIGLIFNGYVIKISPKLGIVEALSTSDFIYSVRIDHKGDWLMATRSSGIVVFKNGQFDQVGSLVEDRDVNWILEDESDDLWICTRHEGVWQIPSRKIVSYTTNNSSVPTNALRKIAVVNDQLYLSTKRNRVYKYDNNQFKELESFQISEKHRNGTYTDFFLDTLTNRTYIGFDLRLGYFDEQEQFNEVQLPKKLSKKFSFHSFLFNKNGKILVFGKGGGIELKEDRMAGLMKKPKMGFGHSAKLEDGRIFVGGAHGLFEYSNGQYLNLDSIHPIFRSQIKSLSAKGDRLWIASLNYGIAFLQHDSITLLEEKINHEKVSGFNLQEDTLWAYSQEHLIKIEAITSNAVRLKKYWIQFSDDIVYRDLAILDDKFYLASNSGLIEIDRKELGKLRTSPTTRITAVKIHGRDTLVQDNYELNYTQDMLQISFGGIHFRSKERRYKYRMTGVDRDWKYTDQKTLQYTKLPAGDYEFTVFTISSDGMVSNVPAKISFSISPPFWKTIWFKFLLIISIAILLLILLRIRIRLALRRKEVDRKLFDLESKALRSQMNPHFIFNVLGAIQGYVSENNTFSSEIYLAKFAKLIRLVLENSRKNFVPLNEELETLTYYIELEQLRFRNKFTYEIKIPDDIDVEAYEIPPMLIQPHIENAIKHGLSAEKDNGKISISLARNKDLLHCEISDNGIGLESGRKQNLDGEYQSFGILISKERLQLLNSRSIGHVKMKIEENNQDSNCGTKVIIDVPIKKIA